MNIDLAIIVYILCGVLTLAVFWIVKLEIRMKNLLRGQDGKSLETTIFTTQKDVQSLEKSKNQIETYLKNVEQRLQQSIQNIETIRFNPFKGSGEGGNQSFAIALLNEKGDGVVLSSLYARERMSVFAKPIKNSVSEFELTNEEKEAIKRKMSHV